LGEFIEEESDEQEAGGPAEHGEALQALELEAKGVLRPVVGHLGDEGRGEPEGGEEIAKEAGIDYSALLKVLVPDVDEHEHEHAEGEGEAGDPVGKHGGGEGERGGEHDGKAGACGGAADQQEGQKEEQHAHCMGAFTVFDEHLDAPGDG
jgi:hypothetical protein